MENDIYLKVGNQPEICLNEKIQGLSYLGLSNSSSSPQITNNYQQVTGVDGSQFLNETFDKRTMNEQFSLDYMNYEDLVLAKHEIYKLFGSRQLIRVRNSTNMAKVYFAYPMAFDIAPFQSGARTATFTIPFDNPSGYWFSIDRSDKARSFVTDDLAYGMGFPSTNIGDYHYHSTSFDVYNPSDIAIDPYYEHHDYKMKISFSGSSIKITNSTNGSSFSYTKAASSTLTYDGLNIYNGDNINDNNNLNANSDYGTIVLEPGHNSFQVTGCSSCSLTFSFPFIYLS